MDQIYLDRLDKLADFLLTVPFGEFDLSSWHCGTTACAVGWACSIPEFKKAGLELVGGVFEEGEKDDAYPVYKYKNHLYDGWSAARRFFGLSWVEADHLFDACSYPNYDKTTPVEVSQRIHEFILKKSKELEINRDSKNVPKEVAKEEKAADVREVSEVW